MSDIVDYNNKRIEQKLGMHKTKFEKTGVHFNNIKCVLLK